MRESVRLAFLAAIQQLPPRQRAALILADVIGWSAAEIGSLLGGSAASVNSMLQRARETMRRNYESEPTGSGPKEEADRQRLLDRYVLAWESTDLDAFVKLLQEDATYSMPPWRQWYWGRAAIGAFFGNVWKAYGGFHLVPVGANFQPAFALYSHAKAGGGWNAHSLQVLSMRGDAVAGLTMFMKPLALKIFPTFQQPLALED
jgi:RNA polymerase sigma-70 factor (ECF subfamily)